MSDFNFAQCLWPGHSLRSGSVSNFQGTVVQSLNTKIISKHKIFNSYLQAGLNLGTFLCCVGMDGTAFGSGCRNIGVSDAFPGAVCAGGAGTGC